MDLSFTFDRGARVTALPTDLAVLLVGIAARQAASPTARIHAQMARRAAPPAILAPFDGAFSTGIVVPVTSGKGQ